MGEAGSTRQEDTQPAKLASLQGAALEEALTELCDRRQTLYLATPYFSFESRFLERLGPDLKVRASRFERVRGEVRVQPRQELAINEFMHPRLEEICETLPAGLGRWLARPHLVHRLVQRWTREGRVVQTSSLRGFLLLWTLARMRRWRRSTLRYVTEQPRIMQWLARIEQWAPRRPDLALEIAACQRLVKGYGDTHARGWANFQTLMQVVDQRGEQLGAAQLKALREAALADEHGVRLRAELEALA